MFKFLRLWKKYPKRDKSLRIPVSQHQEIYEHIRLKVFREWHKDNPERSIVDFYNIPLPSLGLMFKQYSGVTIDMGEKDLEKFFFVFANEAAYTMFLLKWSS